MAHATLRMDGKEFVLVPKSEYARLTARDRADAQKAKRALSALRSGKLRTVSCIASRRSSRMQRKGLSYEQFV